VYWEYACLQVHFHVPWTQDENSVVSKDTSTVLATSLAQDDQPDEKGPLGLSNEVWRNVKAEIVYLLERYPELRDKVARFGDDFIAAQQAQANRSAAEANGWVFMNPEKNS
jgi:hypothetical protein